MTTKEALIAARDLLENVTPLPTDCGQLCSAACCRDSQDEDEVAGMLLFPFEESFYTEPIEGMPFHLADDDTLFEGGKRFICEGKCVREHRPLACRIFPLRMRVEMDGEMLSVVPEIDPRAWCVCPLLEMGGMRAMSQDFVNAVKEAGYILVQNPSMLEALLSEQRLLDEMRQL